MPLVDWNLKATWDLAYSFGAEGDVGHPSTRTEVRLHYHRAIKRPDADIKAARLAAALGWTAPGPTILIVGAGFGWTAEALEDLGYTHVVGTDVSTYIQTNHGGTEEAEMDAEITAVGLDPATGAGLAIKNRLVTRGGGSGNRGRSSRGVLNENGKTGGSRGRIKQSLGLSGNDRIGWAVSESVAESLTDAEAIDGSNDMHNIADNVAHLVVKPKPGALMALNWKTLEEWDALIPGDTWIEDGSFRVL